MSEEPGTQPRPQPAAIRSAATAQRPALLYVLAAFGLIAGAFGAQHALTTGLTLLGPRDAYVRAIAQRNDALKGLVPASEIERYSEREGETRYRRRNAALPLCAVGLILSCLLFAGCMRAMRGDSWGLHAWSLAATASIPYQLIASALALVTVGDLLRAMADLPPSIMSTQLQLERFGAVLMGGIAVLYFGTCVLYLRTLRGRISVGGRTPPSA